MSSIYTDMQPRHGKGSPTAGEWKPDVARASAGEIMPDNDGQYGTLAFPEPAVGSDPQTFIKFFSTAPVSERVLSNAVASFDRHVDIIVKPEARRRADEHFLTEGGRAQLQGLSEWQVDDAYRQERERQYDLVRKEEGLPKRLSGVMSSSVVRCGVMFGWRSLLQKDEDREAVSQHLVTTAAGERTVEQMARKYGTPAWIEEAVTASGDLRAQWQMEGLVKETRLAHRTNESLLSIERQRSMEGY